MTAMRTSEAGQLATTFATFPLSASDTYNPSGRGDSVPNCRHASPAV
jgi:hypothetical protein